MWRLPRPGLRGGGRWARLLERLDRRGRTRPQGGRGPVVLERGPGTRTPFSGRGSSAALRASAPRAGCRGRNGKGTGPRSDAGPEPPHVRAAVSASASGPLPTPGATSPIRHAHRCRRSRDHRGGASRDAVHRRATCFAAVEDCCPWTGGKRVHGPSPAPERWTNLHDLSLLCDP